ncbi:C40 family peptidase [Tianweitania sediminis]|uniref:C40 family peptidase n=1 Tax=Tianweitania sediminis TaxID=1502156 RepID=A0A8J7RP05_9HYPH|nr:NlpC/P60 family protein [Tianweitania sediminis]MBP0440571.1 C40 family peptidase [Tianweitania sediminis]
MTALDRRLHAFRPDLADTRLQGQVEADAFVEGQPARIVVPVADLLREPQLEAGLDTQVLHGEDVRVFEQRDGFAWVQAQDGYVGYLEAEALAPVLGTPTHVVAAPRTFVYAGPDLRFPRRRALSLGSVVQVTEEAETRGTEYSLLETGEALITKHLQPLPYAVLDYVDVAESLLNTPYLWGGASAFGIDCSGLVQLAMRMAGMFALRDTDMQASTIGEPIGPGPDYSLLKRGDLVFWKGHVAIVAGPDEIVHASGHTMCVTRESLAGAVQRIGYLYGAPTAFRRPG